MRYSGADVRAVIVLRTCNANFGDKIMANL